MSSKKILFVSNALANLISRQAFFEGLQRKGFEILTCSPIERPELRAHLAFPHHKIKFSRSGINPLAELVAIKDFIKILKQSRPDIVHIFTLKAILFFGLVARFYKVPSLVLTFTGMGYLYTNPSFKAKCLKFLTELGLRIVFSYSKTVLSVQNQFDYQQLCSIYPKLKGRVIPGSGVDINIYSPQQRTSEKLVIILPARMLKDKGIVEFVAAARQLYQKAKFVLVGGIDLSYPDALSQQQLEAWVCEGVVEWWGYQSNMKDVYAQADIICLPSYREGMPRVLLEAAACGLPIVTTDVPGCRDVVIEGETGFIVPAQSSRLLANALEQLIDNKLLCHKMGVKGREFVVRHCSVDEIVKQTVDLYQV